MVVMVLSAVPMLVVVVSFIFVVVMAVAVVPMFVISFVTFLLYWLFQFTAILSITKAIDFTLQNVVLWCWFNGSFVSGRSGSSKRSVGVKEMGQWD